MVFFRLFSKMALSFFFHFSHDSLAYLYKFKGCTYKGLGVQGQKVDTFSQSNLLPQKELLLFTERRYHFKRSRCSQLKFGPIVKCVRFSMKLKINHFSPIIGEGFIGGVHPSLRFFLFLTSFFKMRKRFFASAIKIISGIY